MSQDFPQGKVQGKSFELVATEGVQSLRPYQPGKPIAELQREYGVSDVVKLASNENPLGPSPKVLAALQDEFADLARYPDGNGFALKQALAAKHGVDMGQITLGNGSSDPLEFVVRVLVQPGDEVLFSEHAFAMYPIVTQAASATSKICTKTSPTSCLIHSSKIAIKNFPYCCPETDRWVILFPRCSPFLFSRSTMGMN